MKRNALLALLLVACGGDTLVPLPASFEMVAAGVLHSCGILTDGAAYCWGNNDYGQLGDGSRKSRIYPVPVVGTVQYTTVSAGAGHTCALSTAGAAYCWGFNRSGQLGDGTNKDRATPAPVAGSHNFVSISAGGAYACGIATDSLAYCWGWNASGQLGDATNADRPSPVAVSGGLKFQAISVNSYHTCALTVAGLAYCWGNNDFGQLGSGNTTASNAPVAVQGGLTFVSVEAGFHHSCGTAADGTGYCWGRSQYGQLGQSGDDSLAFANQSMPTPVAGGLAWAGVSAGAYFSCGVEALTGAAYCWGYNGSGQLGVDNPESVCVDESGIASQCARTPVAVGGGVLFGAVTAATQHTCGLSAGGVAYCWGRGSDGQLGNGQKGSQIFSVLPVRVAGQP